VTLLDSSVGGSVQLVQGGAANLRRNTVGADILFDDNGGALASVNNDIGGKLTGLTEHRGVTMSLNRIDGNLQCKENSPRPVAGKNVVQGNKEDQCRSLQPAEPGANARGRRSDRITAGRAQEGRAGL
jgi:hypothetical protein